MKIEMKDLCNPYRSIDVDFKGQYDISTFYHKGRPTLAQKASTSIMGFKEEKFNIVFSVIVFALSLVVSIIPTSIIIGLFLPEFNSSDTSLKAEIYELVPGALFIFPIAWIMLEGIDKHGYNNLTKNDGLKFPDDQHAVQFFNRLQTDDGKLSRVYEHIDWAASAAGNVRRKYKRSVKMKKSYTGNFADYEEWYDEGLVDTMVAARKIEPQLTEEQMKNFFHSQLEGRMLKLKKEMNEEKNRNIIEQKNLILEMNDMPKIPVHITSMIEMRQMLDEEINNEQMKQKELNGVSRLIIEREQGVR